MKRLTRCLSAVAISTVLLGWQVARAQDDEKPEQGEVMTRGPVHEAFAGTVSFDPEVGTIVSKAPPELIEEVPPDQRPEGDNVSWIPGYWAWDDDEDDFLWISGVWRNLPPGREWIPGYWGDTGDGKFQWTSGYWEDAEAEEVSYIEEAPPKSQERGPNIEAPSSSHSWIPGNWVWQDESYAWRAGYWAPGRDDWSWTPAYYRWTPRGYTYVDGYWDYPVERRGVAFAPVRFEREYISRPDFSYSPTTAIAISVFANHLFLRPSHNHYYFGDYYEPRYRDRGYYASYDYNSRRRGYDPIFARYRWENRDNRDWERGRRDYFEYRRDHRDYRPPHTWRELNSRPQVDRDRRDFGVADRFDRIAGNRDGRQKFQRVSSEDRTRYVSQRQDIRRYGKERAQMEARGKKGSNNDGQRTGVAKATREKINRSPVMAKRSDKTPERLQARGRDRDPRLQKVQKDRNPAGKTREEMNKQGGKQPANSDPERRTTPGQKRDGTPAKKGEGAGKKNNDTNPNRGADGKPGGQGQKKSNPDRKPEGQGQQKANPDRKPANQDQGQKKNTPDRKPEGPGQKKANPDRKPANQEQGQKKATPDRKPEGQGQQKVNPDRKPSEQNKQKADTDRKPQNAPKKQNVAPSVPKKQNPESSKPKPAANPTPKKQANPQPNAQRQAKPQAQRKAASNPKPNAQRKAANQSDGKKKDKDKD